MRFTMEVACDNAAFEGERLGPELARILRHEAAALEEAVTPEVGLAIVQDINGNRVGKAYLSR